ncbi:hypothetical protein ACIRL2_45300 [Embleya sp. NPDC127516]|uniref:hypothetical protein n=1 Tax=Embleya sp. NPDC127516 TaxID=3363990 RepID=UPI00382F9A7F
MSGSTVTRRRPAMSAAVSRSKSRVRFGAVVQEQSPGGQAETRPFLRRPSRFRPDGWTIA